MKKLILFSLSLVFLSTSCDLFKKTVYLYEPPVTKQGISCIENCNSIRGRCVSTCREQKGILNIVDRVTSLIDLPKKNTSINYGFQADVDESNCLGSCLFDFNVCYTSCGGTVVTKQE